MNQVLTSFIKLGCSAIVLISAGAPLFAGAGMAGATVVARTNLAQLEPLILGTGADVVTMVVSDGVAAAANPLMVNVLTRPVLAVGGVVAGKIMLIRPVYAANYQPYAMTNLNVPTVWSPVTNLIINQGGNNIIELEISAGHTFFQLRSP